MKGYRVWADFGPGRVFPFYASVPSREQAEEHAREAILSGAVRAEVITEGRVLAAFEPTEDGRGVESAPVTVPTRSPV